MEEKKLKIALAGNPNSGKTTVYNALTGESEKVGNWAGVTVDKIEHSVSKRYGKGADIVAVDLPGAYSMSPFTSEESIASEYVKNASPDVIVNIVDVTSLERSLFFTTQLLELGIPTVIALNKSDVSEKRSVQIDVDALSERLGCPVVNTSGSKKYGLKQLIFCAVSLVGKEQKAPFFGGNIDLSDRDAVLESDKKRFEFVKQIAASVERKSEGAANKKAHDTADKILTSRWLGLPIFALVMYAVFWLSQTGPAVWIADYLSSLLEGGRDLIAESINTESIWSSILLDGIIGGFIAIVGFLPLVMVMYFLIALLEDCGYMARATMVLDPIFKKVGLSGKSIIPFIIGTGCAVPGVMACRTIRSERERKATAILAPFMPCGAKLPVISLFAGAFFSGSAWVGASMYFLGIIIIFVCALLVNQVTGNKKRSFFIIELPDYRFPSIPRAALSMCQRGWSFIVKAGTVILVCNFAVHVMQNFSWSFTLVENADQSILAGIASPFAYLFAPVIGIVSWQLAAATITGFIAKENVVGTVATCYAITNLINTEELAMESGAASGISSALGISTVAALAYLAFNLFTPPCFAAIGAMAAELRSRKWLFAGIGLQLGVGYTLGFAVYFFGTLITSGKAPELWMTILGWSIVLIFALSVLLLIARAKKSAVITEEK